MSIKLPKEFSGEGIYVSARAGIYAIVNPIGEIYIGQSMDLWARVREHKKTGGRHAKKLASSMLRHGRKNHKYYLVKEIDAGTAIDVFYEWEKFYIKKYKEEGYVLLNVHGGGNGGAIGNRKGRGVLYAMQYEKLKEIMQPGFKG